MRANYEQLLAGFARRQYGVVPRSQLTQVRISPRQVDYMLQSGRLERVFQSVYRVAGTPESWEQMLLAACWAGGVRGSLASHRSACAFWQLPGGDPLLEISGPRWRRARHPGVVSHETKHFDALDVAVLHGAIPVTRPARTFLDCCVLVERGQLAPETAEQMLEEAVRRNLADIHLVGARWERLGGERRPGGHVARRIIDRWLPATAVTDSRAEARLLRLLQAAGLQQPVPQHRVWFGADECVDLDFAWPDARVAIEFDSYRYHGGRLKHDVDAQRLLRLGSRGWVVLRVTDAELDAGCPNALPALRRALRSAA
jgi:very-short-patch-repair endonuclease